MPISGALDTMKIRKNADLNSSFTFDKLKLYYMDKLIRETGESKLVFVISPIWYGCNINRFSPLRDLCIRRNIPFFDFSNDNRFVHNDSLFKDGTHLNSKGADLFTQLLIEKINEFN